MHTGSPAQRAASITNAARARAARTRAARQRQQQYARLLGRGYTIDQAARQLRVSTRQGRRYAQLARQQREVA